MFFYLHMAIVALLTIEVDRVAQSQSWEGNDIDTYAEDLEKLAKELDLYEIKAYK